MGSIVLIFCSSSKLTIPINPKKRELDPIRKVRRIHRKKGHWLGTRARVSFKLGLTSISTKMNFTNVLQPKLAHRIKRSTLCVNRRREIKTQICWISLWKIFRSVKPVQTVPTIIQTHNHSKFNSLMCHVILFRSRLFCRFDRYDWIR